MFQLGPGQQGSFDCVGCILPRVGLASGGVDDMQRIHRVVAEASGITIITVVVISFSVIVVQILQPRCLVSDIG